MSGIVDPSTPEREARERVTELARAPGVRFMGEGARFAEGLDAYAAAVRASACKWQPIETAPKDGRFILLAGPSGYTTTPLRVEVCRWYPEYRPRNPWQTHSNDAFSDGGAAPTHWMPLPPFQPTRPCTICMGTGTISERHGPGLVEELSCENCLGTGSVPEPKGSI